VGRRCVVRASGPALQPQHRGKFVIVEIESGDCELDAEDAATSKRLLSRRPDAVWDGLRIGHRAVCRLGDGAMTILGTVNADREAIIELSIVATSGEIDPVEAIVDAGFNGWLTLPNELIRRLSIPLVGSRHAELGAGQVVTFEAYVAEVHWHERR